MKIKLLCNDPGRYEFLRHAVADKDTTGHDISGGACPDGDLPAFVNGSPPDALIIDGATPASLDAIEALNLRSPGIETLLISDDATADFLMRAMRVGVREVIPATAGLELLQAAMARLRHKRGRAEGAGDGRVFAFLSCKGGSGATFLAANFAYAAARACGRRVALIDLNLQFGDAAIFVSESRPPSNVAELAQQIHRLDASLLAASMLEAAPNFFVLAAPEDPAHAGDVKREHVEAIIRLARQHYDFVVLDVSRSLDAVSLKALDLADTIFPVLQLTLPYVRDGKRLLAVFRSLDYDRAKIELVVNRHEKGGELSLQDLEQALEHKVAHVVPNSYAAAAAAVNLGVPIVQASPANPISKVVTEMCRRYAPAPAPGGGWWTRILARQARH
ncbi:AAA family ATPase [Dechloromonas sp. XY25]|uniref:AAA family ATPase n=1 Tax=Dechloromonas hankyongensis TaxID=2908002 RepID=A0ABS9JZX6_9RHOO|nr:AAA family ATPase [Dechloromonas hankyongensis]MCG2576460.1 AAA family ATPase [Dechloromonas hankyongensis]